MVDYSYFKEDETAVAGVFKFILYLNNAPNKGTGIAKIVDIGLNLLGLLPPTLVDYAVGLQNNLFGGYPDNKDVAPSIIFCVAFFIIGLIHLFIFMVNCSRGHYFYVSIAWIVYCIFRVIGFGLRIGWSKKVYEINIGLVSEFFSIVASVIIVSFNLILAQRLFTWRHPVGGSRKLFWGFMLQLYAFVLILIAITVLASFVPYLHFLSTSTYETWQKVVQFTAVMVIVYCLTSVALIGLSYWSPTKKDEKLYTYQPWWIESFSTFYFVKKGAAKEAEETFMTRNSYHRHAVRVIAATKHEHNMVEGLSNDRGDLSHNISIILLIFSTLAILVGAILRTIVVFDGYLNRDTRPLGDPVVMYICWGLLEFLVNCSYIIWRVDLRFYRPDRLPKKVRDIVTALQSGQRSGNYATDVEDNEERPESFIEVGEVDNDLVFDNNTELTSDDKISDSLLTEGNSDELKTDYHDVKDTPYPTEKEKVKEDASDFKF